MRLIDADKLDDELFDKYPMEENISIFSDLIRNQPTVYSIDKVVQELEEIAERYTNEQECSCGGNEKKCDFYEYKRKGGAE